MVRIIQYFAILLVLLLLSACSLNINKLELAGQNYDKKNYKESFKLYNELYDKGERSTELLNMLGVSYQWGYGTQIDSKKAFNLYQESLMIKKTQRALNNIGILYLNGRGVAVNKKKAYRSFLYAAKMGSPYGKVNLGKMYYNGNGVSKDYKKAGAFFLPIAKINYRLANFYLGEIFFNGGYGVKQNYKQALFFYKRSDKNNEVEGTYKLSLLYKDGLGVEKDTQQSMKLLFKAARLGYSMANYDLGEIFLGIKEYEKARKYFITAANKNEVKSLERLGHIYYKGLGTDISYPLALIMYMRYYEKTKDPNAAYTVAHIYKNKFEESDMESSFEWYKKAALLGHDKSQNNIATMYEIGSVVDQNYYEAIKWYQKSALQGNKIAKKNFDRLYKKGYFRNQPIEQRDVNIFGQGISGATSHIITSCTDGYSLPTKYNLENILSQEKFYKNKECRVKTVFNGGIYPDIYDENGFNDSGIHKDTGTEYNLEGYNRGGFSKMENRSSRKL